MIHRSGLCVSVVRHMTLSDGSVLYREARGVRPLGKSRQTAPRITVLGAARLDGQTVGDPAKGL